MVQGEKIIHKPYTMIHGVELKINMLKYKKKK